MKKKIITFFLFFFLILIILFYFKNIDKNKDSNLSTKVNDSVNIDPNENLTIKKINFSSTDNNNTIYQIFAKEGKVSEKNNNEYILYKVEARINSNSFEEKILISSDIAIYNIKNFNTKFSKNIKMKYLSHEFFCENLDLFVTDYFLEAYENVTYKNLEGELYADKITFNMRNKEIKIEMMNEKKIKIKNKKL